MGVRYALFDKIYAKVQGKKKKNPINYTQRGQGTKKNYNRKLKSKNFSIQETYATITISSPKAAVRWYAALSPAAQIEALKEKKNQKEVKGERVLNRKAWCSHIFLLEKGKAIGHRKREKKYDLTKQCILKQEEILNCSNIRGRADIWTNLQRKRIYAWKYVFAHLDL